MKEPKLVFDFNENSDVLHISLGTGEPSYCEEIDDILLVERGYFSGQITGFEIMDVTYHRNQMNDIDKIAKQTRDFVSSPEGQKSIREALDKASEAARELEEASRIDPQELNEEINT